MRKLIIALILLLCFACLLVGCGGGGAGADGSSDTSAADERTTGSGGGASSALAERLRGEGESASTGQDDDDDPSGDGVQALASGGSGAKGNALVREDTEGLITLSIEDGQGELVYNLGLWDRLHDIYDNAYYPIEEISEGPFYIVTAGGGRIKDACIGKIDDPFEGYLSLRDFITPTVALLMEDGSVEFTRADPYMGVYMFGDNSLYSHGKLPWIKDIVALSYENEKEGIGGMSIFAEDKDGLLYDIKRLYTMAHIFDQEWFFMQDIEGTPEWRYCSLQLSETSHSVAFETGTSDGWGIGDYGIYEGSYQISLAENAPDGRRPGLITFFLTRIQGDTDIEHIDGTYFIQNRDGMTMELWHSNGDHLSYVDGNPLTEFYFYLASESDYGGDGDWDDGYSGDSLFDDEIVIVTSWSDAGLAEFFDDPRFTYYGLAGYTNKTMIDYLLYSVAEARELVQSLGMAALCYGEATELNGVGLCRDVFLGTNRPDQFVREIHYTIADYGDIYEYDAVDDVYYLVYSAAGSVG